MRSLSTSAFGQPSETKEMRGAGRGSGLGDVGHAASIATAQDGGGGKRFRPLPQGEGLGRREYRDYKSFRPERHDAGRIDAPVARVIVMLDVEEVDRLGDARQVVELAQIAAQRRIVPDLAQIALEVPEIDRVEADQRGEQAPVRFRQPLAARESAGRRAAPRASRASRTAPGTPPRRPPAWWRSRRDRRRC